MSDTSSLCDLSTVSTLSEQATCSTIYSAPVCELPSSRPVDIPSYVLCPVLKPGGEWSMRRVIHTGRTRNQNTSNNSDYDDSTDDDKH